MTNKSVAAVIKEPSAVNDKRQVFFDRARMSIMTQRISTTSCVIARFGAFKTRNASESASPAALSAIKRRYQVLL